MVTGICVYVLIGFTLCFLALYSMEKNYKATIDSTAQIVITYLSVALVWPGLLVRALFRFIFKR